MATEKGYTRNSVKQAAELLHKRLHPHNPIKPQPDASDPRHRIGACYQCVDLAAALDIAGLLSPPEQRCEACVAEAFAITSARDPHTCDLSTPPGQPPAPTTPTDAAGGERGGL